MTKITSMSRNLSFLFQALLIIYPIFVVAVWLGNLPLPSGYFSINNLPIDVAAVSLRLRIYACLVYIMPATIVMLSYYYLYKLFNLYSRDIIFSQQSTEYVKKIAYTLFYQVLATILIQPILTLILTMDAPPGEHLISIGITGADMFMLVTSSIIVVISYIMNEGQKLATEAALTV